MLIDRTGQLPPIELSAGERTAAPPAADWLSSRWVSVGLGLALQAALFGYFWVHFGEPAFDIVPPMELLAAVAICIPLHELLHAVMHPGAGFTPATVAGIYREQGLPFCIYTRPCTRRRVIITALSPFVVLSAVPVALSVFAQCPPSLAVMAILNAGGCGLDLGFAYYAWSALPAGAAVGYDRGNLRLVQG